VTSTTAPIASREDEVNNYINETIQKNLAQGIGPNGEYVPTTEATTEPHFEIVTTPRTTTTTEAGDEGGGDDEAEEGGDTEETTPSTDEEEETEVVTPTDDDVTTEAEEEATDASVDEATPGGEDEGDENSLTRNPKLTSRSQLRQKMSPQPNPRLCRHLLTKRKIQSKMKWMRCHLILTPSRGLIRGL